jgi:Helix-turn-helix domain
MQPCKRRVWPRPGSPPAQGRSLPEQAQSEKSQGLGGQSHPIPSIKRQRNQVLRVRFFGGSTDSIEHERPEEIGRWLASHGTPQQVALRSRIVLAVAAGRSDSAVAQELEINRKTVMLWRRRFAQEGIDSLWEVAPGRGRKPTFGPDKIETIVHATLQAKPKGMTQWSCRLMAKNQNVSKSTVSNIWRSHNLKPHRVKSFK